VIRPFDRCGWWRFCNPDVEADCRISCRHRRAHRCRALGVRPRGAPVAGWDYNPDLSTIYTGRTVAALALLFVAAFGLPGSTRQEPADSIAAALRSPQWWVRDKAVRTLGTIRSDASVGLLVGALGDGNGTVRRSARQALAGLGDLAFAGATGALASPSPDIRWQAAWILGHLGGSRVIAPLLRALEDGEAMVRTESGVGLARVGVGANAAAVVEGAARVLQNRGSAGREDAAWLLGQVKSPNGVAPLLAALADPEAGWMAAMSLGVLAAPGATTPLAGAAASLSPKTRRSAVWALAKIGGTAGIPAVQRALADPDDEVRYWASEALRRIGTVQAIRALSSAKSTRWDRRARRCAPDRTPATVASGVLKYNLRSHKISPEILDARPDIPSPLTAADGTELAVVLTGTGRYSIYPVTLTVAGRQCHVDGLDFPTLAATGLHAEIELDAARTVTGRSVSEITELARPGRLSDAGFLGAEEDIVSVIKADNQTVAALGLAHPELARPLLHIWNMMQRDLDAGRWNMADHRWQNVAAVFSHGQTVTLTAGDTKGVQESVFADGIEGSFWIEIGRELTAAERNFLRERYPRLDPARMDALVRSLTRIRTGEMEPHYVMWYGFYEGLTPWRTDPVAIALIFGLKTLEEIEAAFPGRLDELMLTRFTS